MADLGGRVAECRFTINIKGEGLVPDEVTAAIGLEPTRVIPKGAIISHLPEIRAEVPEWIYIIALYHPLGADRALDDTLAHLIAHKEQLTALQQKLDIRLCLHVTSDSAHMSYQLMPETLTALAALKLPLDISSLSWGDVGM